MLLCTVLCLFVAELILVAAARGRQPQQPSSHAKDMYMNNVLSSGLKAPLSGRKSLGGLDSMRPGDAILLSSGLFIA